MKDIALETLDDEFFFTGMTIQDYAKSARNYRSFVNDLLPTAKLDSMEIQRLRSALQMFDAPLRMTVQTEDWCGDWACTVPILTAFCKEAAMELRIFRGSEHPRLAKRYERDGDDHIPAISIWNGGIEILRWIEAPKKVAEMKREWKNAHPEFEETYKRQAESRDIQQQWNRMYRDFMGIMSQWYRDGMWSEVVAELLEKLEKAS